MTHFLQCIHICFDAGQVDLELQDLPPQYEHSFLVMLALCLLSVCELFLLNCTLCCSLEIADKVVSILDIREFSKFISHDFTAVCTASLMVAERFSIGCVTVIETVLSATAAISLSSSMVFARLGMMICAKSFLNPFSVMVTKNSGETTLLALRLKAL